MATDRNKRVLIVDDDKLVHLTAKQVLKGKYECLSAYNGDEARVIMKSNSFDVVLLDMHMRRPTEGLECIPTFLELDPDLDIIIVSGSTEIDTAIQAIRAGASAYLLKEQSAEQLVITIESVLSRRELLRENRHYRSDRKRNLARNQIIGCSPVIQQLLKDIQKVRRTNANVIITGETGTGKELVARHIGEDSDKPFVAVDSATITSTMAESILFGHEKGAFTGALAQQKGLFEEADGGTIYFDEIVNMPLEIQAKILRVIQEKEVTRLGSAKVMPLSFRVLCATNKDLEKLVSEGRFKDDLYQRLNVISLRIPPLRERREDIPLLVEKFLERNRAEHSPSKFSDSSIELLMKYSWPGNVRELSNLVANLCAMVIDQEVVEVEDLPQKVRDLALAASATRTQPLSADSVVVKDAKQDLAASGMDFYQYMHSIEGKVLADLFRAYAGNISQMSKMLKISRSHLYSKLGAHGISR